MSGSGTMFVAKLNTNGSLIWQKHTSTGNGTNKIGQLDFDGNGNIYVGAENNGTGLNGTGSFFGGYLAKLSATGNVVWEKPIAGGDNRINAISVNDFGILYAAGNHSATLNLSSSISFNVASGADGFVAKYDTSGNLLNAMHLASSSIDNVTGVFAPNAIDVFFTFQVEIKDSSDTFLNDAFQIGGRDFYLMRTTDTMDQVQFNIYGNSGTNLDESYALAGNANTITIGGQFTGTLFYLKNQSSKPSVIGNAGTAFVGQFGFTPTVSGPSGPPPTPTYSVTFQVDMENETVDAAGVFLNYIDSNSALSDIAMTNISGKLYVVTLTLDSGINVQYRYKNGTTTIESVPYQCNVIDSLGSYTRQWGFTQNATISLHCWSSCGVCPPPPCQVGTAGLISGLSSFCEGDEEVEFIISPVVEASSYFWYFDGVGQTLAAGQGTNNVKINITEPGGTVLRVYGTDGKCNGDTALLNLATPLFTGRVYN
jgi:hypothetical protein